MATHRKSPRKFNLRLLAIAFGQDLRGRKPLGPVYWIGVSRWLTQNLYTVVRSWLLTCLKMHTIPLGAVSNTEAVGNLVKKRNTARRLLGLGESELNVTENKNSLVISYMKRDIAF